MANTTKLGLPYIAAAQAQKHVTHNEAIRALDAVVQLSVIDQDLTAPPSSPQDGDRYIVASSAINEWAGKDNQIAAWQDGTWMFYQPQEGWLCWIEDEDKLYAWEGTTWIIAGGENVNPAPLVGVNATADTTNRLSVNSPASLFNHEGTDHQLKINKNAVANNASVLFQTGFSGRAEFGLAGDDDFHMKVSPDGSTFHEGIIIDKDTGEVSFPNGHIHAESGSPTTNLIFTPGGSGETTFYNFNRPHSGLPRSAILASVSNDIIEIITNTANFFFSNPEMENVSYIRIWNMSKTPNQSAWVRRVANWGVDTQLQVTNSSDVSGWLNGETIQIGEPSTNNVAIDISQMMQNRLGSVFPQKGVYAKITGAVSDNPTSGGIVGGPQVSLTADGTPGSYINNFYQAPDRNISVQVTVATTVPSPISNSNLIFLRETDNGPDTIYVMFCSIFGIWV